MAWKEAASVILSFASPKLEARLPSMGAELRILMMKRTSSSSFMPDRYVFPGGMIDPVDFDPEWFARFPTLKSVPVPISKQRIPLFRKYVNSPISGEIAFRLCALRETFEESGILLGVKAPYQPFSMNSVKEFGHDEWMHWRSRVKDNPMEFLKLFDELQLLPDIWSLHEWSNWLTPPQIKKRFDTVFFMAFPRDLPYEIHVEESEMSAAKIMRPQDLLRMHMENKLELAKPQIYEMGRLSNFHSVEDLERFTIKRAAEGNVRYSVFRVSHNGKRYFLLPGDSSYPSDMEDNPDAVLSDSISLNENGFLNRIENNEDGDKLLCNVATHGHVLPKITRSKL